MHDNCIGKYREVGSDEWLYYGAGNRQRVEDYIRECAYQEGIKVEYAIYEFQDSETVDYTEE